MRIGIGAGRGEAVVKAPWLKSRGPSALGLLLIPDAQPCNDSEAQDRPIIESHPRARLMASPIHTMQTLDNAPRGKVFQVFNAQFTTEDVVVVGAQARTAICR